MSAPRTCIPAQLKVPELKDELRKRGITPKGLKKDLIEKLEEVLRQEAQEQLDNTYLNNLPQEVQAGSNSPVRHSTPPLGSGGYNSPLPVVDSSQCYIPLPLEADSRNEDDFPAQVVDTKSSHYHPHQLVAGKTTPGDTERENVDVRGDESESMLLAANNDGAASVIIQSALEPGKMECDNQKEEGIEQFKSARMSPLGLVHGSEGLYHDKEEAVGDDSALEPVIIQSALEPGIMECDNQKEEGMEQFKSAGKSPLGLVHGSEGLYHDKEEAVGDDSATTCFVHKVNESGVNESGPDALGMFCDKPDSGDKTMEANAGKTIDKYEKSIFSQTGQNLKETVSNMVSSIVQEQMELRDGHIQFGGLDSPKDRLEAEDKILSMKVHISENVSSESYPKRTSECQLEEQEEKEISLTADKDDILKMSDTGLDSVDKAQSEVRTVSEEAMNQSVGANSTGYDFKSDPRHNYEESETSVVKQAMFDCEPPSKADTWETRDQENKNDMVAILSRTDPCLEDGQKSETNQGILANIEAGCAQNQYISLNASTCDSESKPEINPEEGETDFKQNQEENSPSMDTITCESDPKDKENIMLVQSDRGLTLNQSEQNLAKQTTSGVLLESLAAKSQYVTSRSSSKELSEQTGNTEIVETTCNKQMQAELQIEIREAKESALTHQSDDMVISTTSNIILEKQQFETKSYSEENAEAQSGQSNKSSLDLPQHDQLCETDPCMAEERKQETIVALEESMESEDLQSQIIAQKSPVHEFELKPRASSVVLEAEDEHYMKRKGEKYEELEDESNELDLRGEKFSDKILNEWKRTPEFPIPQLTVDSDSPREISENSETVKLGHVKTAEVDPMDIEFDCQTGKKRKNEGTNEDGEPRQEPAKRQRRWNSGKNLLDASNTKPLTTDTLKDIVSEEATEVSNGSNSLHPVILNAYNSASQSLPKAQKTSFSRPAPPPLKSNSTSNGEIQKPRTVPPPLRSPTTSLKVERFLRPFTIKALKELLSKTGTVIYFWMDQIKTHCYVTYSSVEEAVATRNALYNLKWPVIGGRLLIAEFVDPEEVKLHCEDQSSNLTNTSNLVPPKDINQGSSQIAPQGSSAQALSSPRLPGSKPKQPLVSKKTPEPEPPIYTLDDLFKKTRAKPHIYYLPLSGEQVAAKLDAGSQDQLKQAANKPNIKS